MTTDLQSLSQAEQNEYWKRLSLDDPAIFRARYLQRNSPLHQRKWLNLMRKTERLLLLCPCDHGKTQTLIDYLTYEISINRDQRITIIAETEPRAQALLRAIAAQLENNIRLVRSFGRFRDKNLPWTEEYLYVKTERQEGDSYSLQDANLYASGFFGNLLGRRSDLIALDDPYTYEIAREPQGKSRISRRFFEIIENLLEPDARLIMTGTVQEDGDLYETLRNEDRGYKVVVERAITSWRDKNVLWEEKWPYDKLIKRKNTIGEIHFQLRYQNELVSHSGGWFPEQIREKALREDITVDELRRQMHKMKVLTGIDLASSSGPSSFAILTIGFDDAGNQYMLNLQKRPDLTAPAQHALLEDEANHYKPAWVITESNAYQRSFQELATARGFNVKPLNTSREKHRLDIGIPSLSVAMEQGRVFIPYGDHQSRKLFDPLIQELRMSKGDALMAWWLIHKEQSGLQSIDITKREPVKTQSILNQRPTYYGRRRKQNVRPIEELDDLLAKYAQLDEEKEAAEDRLFEANKNMPTDLSQEFLK